MAACLANGETDAQTLLSGTLEHIDELAIEHGKTFTRVYCDTARIEAESADNLRLNGVSPTPLAGVPVSVKDLCDVRAELWRSRKP